MTEQTGGTANSKPATDKDQSGGGKTPPPAPKAKEPEAPTVKHAAKPWDGEPKLNKLGQQLGADNLPTGRLARAMALAAAGQATDPGGIVTDEEIAAHDPVAAQADKDAVAAFHIEEAEAAKAASIAAAEAAQPGPAA